MRALASLALLPLMALPSPARAQAPLDYRQAYERAQADEASLQGQDNRRLLESQGRLVGAAAAACASPSADPAPFVVVAELDAAGRVVRTWREGATPLAICFEKQLAQATLFTPPRTPFHTFIEMSFTP
ncbi:hypothetical protein [Pseudoxanthomonas mexicana]|uniref:hypothetical protein n=1 Tax=Pseudoxanthomonas mexicana TaxID=128785 RepID=UPI00398B2B5D